MVKVDNDTLNYLKTEWDKPIDFDDKDEDSAGLPPSPTSVAAIQRSAAAPSLKLKAPVPLPENQGRIIKNGDFRNPPSKDVTGVDESIVEICASLSNQIYDAYSKDYFHLEASNGDKAEVLIHDTHGNLNPAIPAFAVAVVDSTLIMGWRGTNQVMDFINDVALAPVVCNELGTAATGVRCHAMFSSCVGSNLKVYEEEIISIIKKRRIMNIVFTGHSLGGALASVAHMFLTAQIGGYNKSSWWDKLGRLKSSLNAVTFAAPMNVLDRDEQGGNNRLANQLLEEVGANTANFVFHCDAVPRAYGHVGYLHDVINEAAPEAVRDKNPIWFGLGSGRISSSIINFMLSAVTPLVPIAVEYRHTGRLIYYEDKASTTPLILEDTGPAGKQKSPDKSHLNHYDFSSYKIRRGEYIETLLEAHSHFPKTFAPYISVDKDEVN
mmetsp:Transcript_38794/g.85163  ORF Transcript_38794/g.85163 Transcript_38794/m.85163 type:complete len:437 (+) Transcript_38794:117-1427(+)